MIDNIQSKKMSELRDIAKQLNLSGVRGESKQSLATRITFALQPGLLEELNKNGTEQVKPQTKPKSETQWLTVPQVMEALSPYKDKIKLAFYDQYGQPTTTDAKTWHVKNGPAEDSGTMSISLNWLKVKVGEIANARFPAALTGRSNTPLFL